MELNPLNPLAAIETWIFDLDNTLYPGTCELYREIEQRMAAFIMEELKLDHEGAHALRRRFLDRHGTTLKGLMIEYGLAPERFLDYVHEIDLSAVEEDVELGEAIAALPGRKLIFTNGTQRHAERVLGRSASARISPPSTTSSLATTRRSPIPPPMPRSSPNTRSTRRVRR